MRVWYMSTCNSVLVSFVQSISAGLVMCIHVHARTMDWGNMVCAVQRDVGRGGRKSFPAVCVIAAVIVWQDFTVFGGSLSSMHAKKICKVSFLSSSSVNVCMNYMYIHVHYIICLQKV